MKTLARASVACLALSCVLLCAADTTTHQIAPGACNGFPYTDIGQKFHYTTEVTISGNDTSCISISKLYVQDACISDRNNELGLKSAKLTCAKTDDESDETCNTLFSPTDPKAPADAIVNGTNAVSGTGTYDSGDVCAAESNAFIYVKSTCTDEATVGITITTTKYQGKDLCISVAGRHIGGVGIALIIAAILIVVILAALLCYCCCCRW